MESRHRRSTRDVVVDHIGWTVGGDGDQYDQRGVQSLSASSPLVLSDADSTGAGRIYPGLFAGEDEDDNGNNNGHKCRRDQQKNGGEAMGAGCSIGGSTNWPAADSVSMEEQPPDDEQDFEEDRQDDEAEEYYMTITTRNRTSNDGGTTENGGNGMDFWQAPAPYQSLLVFLIGLLLLLVFVLPPLFSAVFFDVQQQKQQPQHHSSPTDRLRVFRQGLQQMLNQTHFANTVPRVKYNIEKKLNYLAGQMQHRQSQRQNALTTNNGVINAQNGDAGRTLFGQYHPAPLVLLIASSRCTRNDGLGGCAADFFAAQYVDLLMEHWPQYRLINITTQPGHTKFDLFNVLVRPLLSTPTAELASSSWWRIWWHLPWAGSPNDDDDHLVLMLLNRIERLHGAAPLFLHSLADPESSPIVEATGRHNVLIILTMALSNETINNNDQQHSSDGQECDEQISRSLLASWQSDVMTADQIQPILARIGATSLCVF